MKYQGGNKNAYLKDLASHVFGLLQFTNECHDPHSGEFCEKHGVVHPNALAAASGGYGTSRWAKEQEMKKSGETYKPYGKTKPLRATQHLSDRLKDIGLNVPPDQIEKLIREKTPVYIEHEHSTKPGQNPVYHFDLPKLGFEIGFGVAPDGGITTVYPTGYKIEAEAFKAYKAAGSPRTVRGGPNVRADAKRATAKKIVQEAMRSK